MPIDVRRCAKIWLFLVVMVFSVSTLGMEVCENLVPLSNPMPAYPNPEQAKDYLPGTLYAHIFVEGFVAVSYTVETSGKVTEVKIVDSENRPTQKIEGREFDGFLESNVISTVARWKYKAVPADCEASQIFRYQQSVKA